MVYFCFAVCCVCGTYINPAKIGIDGVNSNLATAIRTIVVLVMAWGMVFLTNDQIAITEISIKSLAIPDPFGSGNGCIMVMLLLCAADWRRIESCTD